MPLLILPSKETVEVLLHKGKRQMSQRENVLWTFILVFISYIFAIFVPSIGDAMALAGCTTNPMVTILIPHILLSNFRLDLLYL
jgi:amino acid permease